MSLKSAALCLSALIVSHPGAAQAQSASKVIERHIDAIGGKKAVEKIVSTDLSGRVSSADGRSGVFTQRTTRPHLFTVSLSWGDSRWRTGFNGRSAWQDDSVDGVRTLYGPAASRVRVEASYANARFMMSEKINQVSVTGRDTVRGRPAIVVLAIASDGTQRTLFFDAGSYLLVKDEQQTDAGVEERFFDDYRPVDRVMEPHRIEWHRNGETFRIAVERVTHNAPLDGRMFDVPAAPAEPPLDIDAVLAAARDNEKGAESLRTSYAYTQTVTIGRLDRQGRLTEKEYRTYQVFHLGGRPVGRLLRKNGQALGETERRREDERVNDVVREYERQRPSGGREPEERRTLDVGLVRLPVEWFLTYLRTSEFSNIRRERLRGRAVVVVDFQPKRSEPRNGPVGFYASVAGTLWIDETSQHAIQVEAYFCDDDGRIVQGSSVRAERALVNDELWLPSRDEHHLRNAFPVGKPSNNVLAIEYADYKKFTVETDSTVTLPHP